MKKAIRQVAVKNPHGLHVRPATKIAELVRKRASKVYLTFQDATINACSIISILLLEVGRDAKLTITVEGNDAEETLGVLVDAFEKRFEE